MDSSEQIPILLPALFPVFFIAIWCGICLLLSRLGGWDKLARSYRYENADIDIIKSFFMQSAGMGQTSYNNCVLIKVAEKGLHLSVFPIFRLGHPPLFFPWDALPMPETKRMLWMTYHVYEIDGVKLSISDKPVAYALQYIEQKAIG